MFDNKEKDKALQALRLRCRMYDVDFRIAEELFHTYYVLLDNAHALKGMHFDKNYLEKRDSQNLRMKNAGRVLKTMKKLRDVKNVFSEEEKATISLHLEYLAPIEGMLNPEIGFLIYTLIANGYIFKISGKNITDYQKITETTLGTKLRFLREKNVFPLIYSNIDANLRNAIGHMFYEMNDQGTIHVDGRPIDYENTYSLMREIGFSLNLIINVYYDKYKPK